MIKIFRCECRRLLCNKFFIGLLAVLLFYAGQVFYAVALPGVAHTAPFSPWSFGAYLGRLLPLVWVGALFFLTFFTSARERRAAVLTDATRAAYETSGHQETELPDDVVERFEKVHMSVNTVNLLTDGGVPADCDLLIIDDLGTELANSFTSSALFQCINERAIRRKPVIISTNLSLGSLRDIYSERVFSRIASNYKLLKIFGRDLRILPSLR